MIIDIHTHHLPQEFIEDMRNGQIDFGAKIVQNSNGNEIIKHTSNLAYPLLKSYFDQESRFLDMDKRSIDIEVISIFPGFFGYNLEVGRAKWASRTANESIAKMVHASKRFLGFGTLPLQSIQDSLDELKYLIDNLGLNGIEIGTHVKEMGIWDPYMFPVYELANDIGLVIFVHPNMGVHLQALKQYYLGNIIGHPLATTIAINHLICGGVIEHYPDIKWVFSHAGGFFPYQWGRLEHGYKVRPEVQKNIKLPPNKYLDKIYCDTISHYSPALNYIVDILGSNNLLLGSDYPFDMADFDPVNTVNQVAGLDAEVKRKILGLNARNLFGIINRNS